ncbi:bifunctional chorismate-binding protein/class IV aminotransferase [Neisseria shayeganii]|uniref:Chorismate-binding protein n=1 Tax=Neisseria shayeganii TaxID=607712 RepID=A0A7D7N352_9NEIS|nr:bifunctional chorismate-binding protein/class IV aminotransferase [Neisseria shayeganii]QMT40265.1 chorismate-binding protein [Neisseria shayeganii]
MPYFALFDDAHSGQARLLTQHRRSLRLSPDQLDRLDAELQAGWAQGWHVCLCLPYEFGHALHYPEPGHTPSSAGIHWFAEESLLDPEALNHWLAAYSTDDSAGLCALAADTDETGYLKHIADIQAAIAHGEVYQINYTTRLHSESYGSPAALYRRLRQRQPVPYGFLAKLPEEAHQWTLCLSPELFLRIGEDGSVETEPMKGTAPLLGDEGDAERAEALRLDPKNRAENVMIVDLLRNDLGRIAVTGGVSVPEVFTVRPFGQVWQMTSRIRALPRPGTTAAQLLRATFPCGSITGAPKHMSLEKIRQLESSPRHLYTGSIGYLKPCPGGLGFHGTLNVAIRTLLLNPLPDSNRYRGVFGVGSGIVTDSQAEDEYRECGWKARFLSSLPPDFSLIESMRLEHGACPLLPLHRRRLQHSADILRFPPPDEALWQHIAEQAAADHRPALLRLEYCPDGRAELSLRPLHELPAISPYLILSPLSLPRHDFLRRFKTSRRRLFDQAWQQAEAQDAFDSLLFNEDGHLLEGGRSSIFVRFGSIWYTPPLSLDILDSVMRQRILADPETHLGADTDSVQEGLMTRRTLMQADEIVAANAVRGVMRMHLQASA